MEPALRVMRATDMVRFTRYALPKFYGVVVMMDGAEIGAGAIVWGDKGRAYLCLEISDALRKKPIFMTKVAHSLIAGATSGGGELFTVEDAEEPTSPEWLSRLGFVDTGEKIGKERVLSWRKS
jgi:uncharacterized protein (DUF736 family)